MYELEMTVQILSGGLYRDFISCIKKVLKIWNRGKTLNLVFELLQENV